MDSATRFSARLDELMRVDSISSDTLGRAIGCGGSTVRQWRLGVSLPVIDLAVKLVEYFGCSMDYMFGRATIDIEYQPHDIVPFYHRIRQLLLLYNVSWYRVSKSTNIAKSSMYDWSLGRQPQMNTIIVLADYLDCTIDYLIGRDM